jgi:hypothetical protein
MVEPKPLRPRARRGGSTGKTVERVSLDIVDLRVIESELSAIGPIILTSEQFEGEAASVDEFTNHDLQSLDELSFSVQDPETFRRPISVDLTRERAFIWIRDTSHALAGAQLQVEQILRTRRRRVGVWAERVTLPLCFAAPLSFLALATFAGERKNGQDVLAVGWLVIPLGLLLLALAAGMTSRFTRGQILLVPRQQAPGWLTRNRDALIVQILGGAVLLLLGVVIGRLL